MHFESPAARRVLLLTSDSTLRDEVCRVAAAADCAVEEQNLPVGRSEARALWERCDVVVLDLVTARLVAELGLPRRPSVVVVTRQPPVVDDWRSATAIGAEHVLHCAAEQDALVALLGESAVSGWNGDGGVVAVVGGRGGAGASTFAAALALTSAARGNRTLLVEGDRFGSGLDLILGWEDSPGLRWSGLTVEGGRVSAESLHGALPNRNDLSVLALGGAPRASGPTAVATAAVLAAGRAAGDLVVCDAPRHPDEVGDVIFDAADLVVLVVPAEVRAVAGAESVAAHLVSGNPNVGLVVRGPAPGGLRANDIADAVQLPLLASMRPEPGLAGRLERGGLRLGRRSPLAGAAFSILGTFERKPRARGWVA